MLRVVLAFILLAATLSLAQSPAPASCYADRTDNEPYRHKLWSGYEVSLGLARNRELGAGNDCTAAIYNGAGKAVFRTTGFNVLFDDKLTGKDFDGDGLPDVVFQTDSGGGMHCCWAYNIVSLSPTPHRLFDIDASAAVRFEPSPRGMLIWQRRMGPADFTSMAQRPAAEKVMRVVNGKPADVTPEFCSKLLAPGNEDYDEQQRVLTPAKLRQLATLDRPDEETASALLSRALQHVFCRQLDLALADLEPWPRPTRDKMKADLAEYLRTDYPSFSARLAHR